MSTLGSAYGKLHPKELKSKTEKEILELDKSQCGIWTMR